MNDNRNNFETERSKEDLKAWIKSHPHEYGEVAMEMGEADLFSVFLMAQAAFISSPEFQKRLEDMVDTDSVDVGELVEILHQLRFTEKMLTNPNGNEDWEKEIRRTITYKEKIINGDSKYSDFDYYVGNLSYQQNHPQFAYLRGLCETARTKRITFEAENFM